MPKQPKEKSAHLQELEAVFDRHTRRFSPFDVLGLRSGDQETAGTHVEEIKENNLSNNTHVDTTHPHVSPTNNQRVPHLPQGRGSTPKL